MKGGISCNNESLKVRPRKHGARVSILEGVYLYQTAVYDLFKR